jgi:hypothetical protein
LIAVITGRRTEEAAALLAVPHVAVFGLYGFEDGAPELVTAAVPLVEAAARTVPEAWVEDKGASIAVIYRRRPIPCSRRAGARAATCRDGGGLSRRGKMVVELALAGAR